jgi:hypothetical protein
MVTIPSLLFVTLNAVAAAPPPRPTEEPDRFPNRIRITSRVGIGHIAAGFAYAYRPASTDKAGRYTPEQVLRAKLTPAERAAVVTERYSLHHSAFGDYPYRWHVSHGCFWGDGATVVAYYYLYCRIPLDELALAPIYKEKNRQILARKYPGYTLGDGPFRWGRRPLYSIYKLYGGKIIGMGPGTPPSPTYFDTLPVGSREVLMLVLGRGELRVWRGKAAWSAVEQEWKTEWKEVAALRAKAPVTEPFFAFGDAKRQYLVTVSGKLYAALPDGEGRVVKALWVETKRPITFVVGDGDTDGAYAFVPPAPDDKKGKPAYFELAEKVKLQPYRPGKVEPKAPGPLAETLKHAWVLVEDRKLRIP